MMISNCPRCHEPYRIPTDSLPADAYAKCPWCHETFPLQEALRHLPPVLKIIGADGREISGLGLSGRSLGAGAVSAGADAMSYAGNARGLSAQRHTAVDDNDLDGAIAFDMTGDYDEPASPMRIEADNEDELDPEFVIQDARGTQKIAPMRVQPLPPLNSSPRRKKKGSPLKTLFGIALGPVIAIPAAAGILLGLDYMGIKEAPNLGVWPMDGSYSWTSASNNRSAAAPMPTTEAPSTEALSPSPSRATPPTGRSLGEELGTGDPTSIDPATSALELITSPEVTSVPDSVSIEALKTDVSMPVVTAPEVESPEVTEPVVTASEVTMPSAEVTEPTPPASEPAASEPAASEPAAAEPAVATYAPELVAARDKATEMLDQVAALAPTDGKFKNVLSNTYVSLANVGSLLDPSTKAVGEEIIAKLKADESTLNRIASATPQWLNLLKANRPNQGVVIVGDLVTSGDSVTIRLANDELLSIEDVDASITNGKVIGLGKIIDGPNGQSVRLTLVESL